MLGGGTDIGQDNIHHRIKSINRFIDHNSNLNSLNNSVINTSKRRVERLGIPITKLVGNDTKLP
jgi:hypothetical protein